MNNQHLTYRPDIDVLRAIAVLSVVAFHWQIMPFQGGFVGVDVFFVISGFLISNIIMTESDNRTFSFTKFYERRIRRILPALYVMVMCVFALSWVYLVPSGYDALSRSIASVITFSSNFLFWNQSGYFDISHLDKPLLHTWSLAVEEQFYLIFPVIIWLLAKRSPTHIFKQMRLYCLILMACLSFYISVHYLKKHPSASFYLPASRAWEFLIGSILATGAISAPQNKFIQYAGGIIGLLLLAGSIIILSEKSHFPGVNALYPCIGTAMLIWSQQYQSRRLQNLLPYRIATFFGKISYSLYLWHWPLYVFALIILGAATDISSTQKLGLFAACVVIAYLSFKYIEQPIRGNKKLVHIRLYANTLAASLVLLVASVVTIQENGFPARFGTYIASVSSYTTYDRKDLYREETCLVAPNQTVSNFPIAKCFKPIANKVNVLLWGDSIAAHYYQALLSKLPTNVNLMQANFESCAPLAVKDNVNNPECERFNKKVLSLIQQQKPDVVIMSANSRYYSESAGITNWIAMLHTTIKQINDQGVPVILFGPSIEYTQPLPKILSKYRTQRIGTHAAAEAINKHIFDIDTEMRLSFATSSSHSSVQYISILDAACPNHDCPVFTKQSVPMEWDTIHLTAEGSAYVVDRIMPTLTHELNVTQG